MGTKHKNLYLYLALACFLGLIAIFVFDGYIGVYDTLSITAGEREEKIEPDFWLSPGNIWSTSVNRGDRTAFSYEVDNRQFSGYTADINVSVWRSQEKVRDLLSQQVVVASFGKQKLEWVVETAQLLPPDIPPEQSYQVTVVIKRGEVERRAILYINPLPAAIKLVPPVPR